MTHKTMTIPEIRKAGLEALRERLGPAGMLQFLQLYDSGQGDYTKDRHAWLKDVSVEDVAQSVRDRRPEGE